MVSRVEGKGKPQAASTPERAASATRVPVQKPEGRVDLALLQEENNALIHRITEMQQSKWQLEERLKDLESLNRTLCEDVAQKALLLGFSAIFADTFSSRAP